MNSRIQAGVVRPGPGRDHLPIDHRGRVDELGSGRGGGFGRQRRVGSGPAARQRPGRGEDLGRVAQLGDRLVALHEVPHDPLHVRVVADVLRSPAAGNDQGDVASRVDVGEGKVRGPGVAEFSV